MNDPAFGIPASCDSAMSELQSMLEHVGVIVQRSAGGLIVKNRFRGVCIDFFPAEQEGMRGAIALTVAIPKGLHHWFEDDEETDKWNQIATLGSFIRFEEEIHIVARTGVPEDEHLWGLSQAMVVAFVFTLDGVMCSMTSELLPPDLRRDAADHGPAEWQKEDFEAVYRRLSRSYPCSYDDCSLTCEIPVGDGETDAQGRTGYRTALWYMTTAEIHPDLGRGLKCTLTIPFRFQDGFRCRSLADRLNRIEASSAESTPFFGSWISDHRESSILSFVSFLPNHMHGLPIIAFQFSRWAIDRAEWCFRLLQDGI